MKTIWKSDPMHSEVHFKVKHLMITTITGNFNEFELDVETEGEDFTKATLIKFSADVESVSTNNEQRDNHLKSDEFFDLAEYPQIVFNGTALEENGDGHLLKGNLTIKGTTKPVTMALEFGGVAVDGYGQTKAGFTVTGKISRKDFGLTWGAVTEAGQIVVGDDIKISSEIQLIKQP